MKIICHNDRGCSLIFIKGIIERNRYKKSNGRQQLYNID